MTRPLRIEFPGAWYHLMNRGTNRQAIFAHDSQRQLFLDILSTVTQRFWIECHAYCLMDNHFHLLIHTPLGQLGRAMRHLGGIRNDSINSKDEMAPYFGGVTGRSSLMRMPI